MSSPLHPGKSAGSETLKIAYVLSRFPLLTETFILREFDRVSREPGVEVRLYSLFPSRYTVAHEEARPWIARRRRPSWIRAVLASVREFAAAPVATLRLLGAVIRQYVASPRRLAKALATTAIAMDHVRDMRRSEIAHVHAHFATYPALAAWVAHRSLGVSYSLTPHAHDIFIDQTGLRQRLSEASSVVAVSRYNWMFLQHFGANPEHLRRLSYGLDLVQYRFEPRSVPIAGAARVVVVASFKPYKGHRMLLEALAAHPDLGRLDVEFIGGGRLEAEMKDLAQHLGVSSQCRFSGARDQTYVRERFAVAHLLVQPSIVQEDGDTEGLPNTLIEAAAVGITMVATNVTGIPELVEDGVSGFLAEPRSATSLAAALSRALRAGDAVRGMQQEARRRVEDRHDLNTLAAELVEMFRSCVAGQTGSSSPKAAASAQASARESRPAGPPSTAPSARSPHDPRRHAR